MSTYLYLRLQYDVHGNLIWNVFDTIYSVTIGNVIYSATMVGQNIHTSRVRVKLAHISVMDEILTCVAYLLPHMVFNRNLLYVWHETINEKIEIFAWRERDI